MLVNVNINQINENPKSSIFLQNKYGFKGDWVVEGGWEK